MYSIVAVLNNLLSTICLLNTFRFNVVNIDETGINMASCSDTVLTEGDYVDAEYSDKDYTNAAYGDSTYGGLEYPGLEYIPSSYEDAEYANPDYAAAEYDGSQYAEQGYSGGRYVEPSYGYQQYANTEYADSINPDYGRTDMMDAENYIESKDEDDYLQNSSNYLDQSVDTQGKLHKKSSIYKHKNTGPMLDPHFFILRIV